MKLRQSTDSSKVQGGSKGVKTDRPTVSELLDKAFQNSSALENDSVSAVSKKDESEDDASEEFSHGVRVSPAPD